MNCSWPSDRNPDISLPRGGSLSIGWRIRLPLPYSVWFNKPLYPFPQDHSRVLCRLWQSITKTNYSNIHRRQGKFVWFEKHLLLYFCDGSASPNKLNILHSSSILGSHYPSGAHVRAQVLLNSMQLVQREALQLWQQKRCKLITKQAQMTK